MIFDDSMINLQLSIVYVSKRLVEIVLRVEVLALIAWLCFVAIKFGHDFEELEDLSPGSKREN